MNFIVTRLVADQADLVDHQAAPTPTRPSRMQRPHPYYIASAVEAPRLCQIHRPARGASGAVRGRRAPTGRALRTSHCAAGRGPASSRVVTPKSLARLADRSTHRGLRPIPAHREAMHRRAKFLLEARRPPSYLRSGAWMNAFSTTGLSSGSNLSAPTTMMCSADEYRRINIKFCA
jgi:hypothetical protein